MGSSKPWQPVDLERRVLAAAAAIGGMAAASQWFEIPIPDLDGLSPRELVQQGRTAEALEYLEMLRAEVMWIEPEHTRPRARSVPLP
jgi:hypothetical protein